MSPRRARARPLTRRFRLRPPHRPPRLAPDSCCRSAGGDPGRCRICEVWCSVPGSGRRYPAGLGFCAGYSPASGQRPGLSIAPARNRPRDRAGRRKRIEFSASGPQEPIGRRAAAGFVAAESFRTFPPPQCPPGRQTNGSAIWSSGSDYGRAFTRDIGLSRAGTRTGGGCSEPTTRQSNRKLNCRPWPSPLSSLRVSVGPVIEQGEPAGPVVESKEVASPEPPACGERRDSRAGNAGCADF